MEGSGGAPTSNSSPPLKPDGMVGEKIEGTWAVLNGSNSLARRTPPSTRLDGSSRLKLDGPNQSRCYDFLCHVRGAVGRRISRRWALNSRFCRAMKMSRLINTSGLPSPFNPSSHPHRCPASPSHVSQFRLSRLFLPHLFAAFIRLRDAFFFLVGPKATPRKNYGRYRDDCYA